VDVAEQHVRREHQEGAERHQQQLRAEVGDREDDVQRGGLTDTDDVHAREHRRQHDREDHVAGPVPQRREEQPTDVVRHEER